MTVVGVSHLQLHLSNFPVIAPTTGWSSTGKGGYQPLAPDPQHDLSDPPSTTHQLNGEPNKLVDWPQTSRPAAYRRIGP